MKKWIKRKLIKLPRSFRVYWGRIFIQMLGKMPQETEKDILLFNELRQWISDNKA